MPRDGHVLTVRQPITIRRTVPVRPFVITHHLIDHLFTEIPPLQSAVILTTGTAQEMPAHINTSAYPAKAIIPEPSAQTKGTPTSKTCITTS